MISATIIGRIGKDADLRQAGGTPVVSFNVASSEKRKDGETTTWTRCSFWGARAEKLAQYLTKGGQVAVRGSLSLQEFTGNDGAKRASLEMRVEDIELLGGKRDGAQPAANGGRPANAGDAYEDEPGF